MSVFVTASVTLAKLKDLVFLLLIMSQVLDMALI